MGPEASQTDYRGFAYQTETVQGYSLETIARGLDVIDFIAMDVQGAETEIVHGASNWLKSNAHHVFIGTHSRMIQHRLLAMFHEMGWDLLWEQPCSVTFDPKGPTIESMTSMHGEQFWRNPMLT